MPNRSLADLKQRDWIRACKKLGVQIETRHGKGSHVLAKHVSDERKYTIQKSLHKLINQKIFKKMLDWGFSEEQIWEALN